MEKIQFLKSFFESAIESESIFNRPIELYFNN